MDGVERSGTESIGAAVETARIKNKAGNVPIWFNCFTTNKYRIKEERFLW